MTSFQTLTHVREYEALPPLPHFESFKWAEIQAPRFIGMLLIGLGTPMTIPQVIR